MTLCALSRPCRATTSGASLFVDKCTYFYSLGSHEAPPAVVSVYLGDEVDNLCQWLMGNIEAVEKREETLKFRTEAIVMGFVIIYLLGVSGYVDSCA